MAKDKATTRKPRSIIRRVMPLLGLSFLAWQFYSMQARDVGDDLLKSGENVLVKIGDDSITFTPVVDTLGVGLLFYPGGLVDPVAYTPMAHQLATAGYQVQIIKIPYRITVMKWQKREVEARTLDALSEKKWVLAGHSRGARMTLSFAASNKSSLAGIILIGSSHPREIDYSDLDLPIMKVYGSKDGLASPAEVEQFKHNLPLDTRWVLIEGANHSQFAWYGAQFGDDDATITRDAQQAQLHTAIKDFLEGIRV